MEKRTEKNCYESRYGGGWITANQRLAEIACERLAEGTTLGARFWIQPPWDKTFRLQATHASRLLKSFSAQAILKTLASPRGKSIKSLGAPFLRPLIETEQKKLELEKKTLELAPLPESINTLETPRPIKREGRSLREKLEDSKNGPTEGDFFD